MRILVLNCGSSSIKSQVIETSAEQIEASKDVVASRVTLERIGTPDAILTAIDCDGHRSRTTRPVSGFDEGLRVSLEAHRCDLSAITGVGHRIVHGGERFSQSTIMTPEVVGAIEDLIGLAPLHNPHNLKGYYAAAKLLPEAQNVAVFDTAFHRSLPSNAFLYGIPYAYYTRDRIRRYGFHGLSHRYVSYRYAQVHERTQADYKFITCHLGNGASVCAIRHGKSVDTSMGFTPLEGLMMGTRSGDLDPGAIATMMAQEENSIHDIEAILNRQSGLLGLSGLSQDMRTLLEHRANGSGRAALAIDVFTYRIKKYIGAYFAVLNGADALIFTGGIGENAGAIREEACAGLEALGIVIDPERNAAAAGREGCISSDSSSVAVWVIPTNEELLIARDTFRCIYGLPQP